MTELLYFKNREAEGFGFQTGESLGWPIVHGMALNPALTEIREATATEALAYEAGRQKGSFILLVVDGGMWTDPAARGPFATAEEATAFSLSEYHVDPETLDPEPPIQTVVVGVDPVP